LDGFDKVSNVVHNLLRPAKLSMNS